MTDIELQHIEVPQEAKFVRFLIPGVQEEIWKALGDVGEPADYRSISKTWKSIRNFNSNGRAYGVQFKATEDTEVLPYTYLISGEVKKRSDLDTDKFDDEQEQEAVNHALKDAEWCTHYIKTRLGEILAYDPETMILVADDHHHEPYKENFIW